MDLAYFAGYFDGEGCVRLKKYPQKAGGVQYYFGVSITNTYQPALERFVDAFGGKIYRSNKDSSKGRHAGMWELRGEAAERFLSAIIPFLQEKRAQAELALQFRQLRSQLPRQIGPSWPEGDAIIDEVARLKKQETFQWAN
jgi:hypothetical protein